MSGSNRNTELEKVKIDSTLPPNGVQNRLSLRPKSNLTNMVSSQIRSRRPSKLKISLKVAVHVDDKMRYSTPQSCLTDSKNFSKLGDKTKHVVFGKRSTKNSRKRSKSKLWFSDKREMSRISKNKKNMNVSRSSSIKKKRKDIQSKYMNSELFKSVDMKKKAELYDSKRCLSGNLSKLSKYDSTSLTLTNLGHKSSWGMYEHPNGLWSNKSDCKKSLFTTTKIKPLKSRTKTKNFKLFKKRNLNSKISRELKLTDITKFSPNKSKLSRHKKHPSIF